MAAGLTKTQDKATHEWQTTGLGLTAKATAGAAVDAAGRISQGPVGLDGRASGFAGAEAQGSAKLGRDGLALDAGAFAGAKARGSAGADVGGIGLSGTAEAWAGAGAEAGIKFGKQENGKYEFGSSAGASPVVGGRLGFEVSVDPNEVKKTASEAGNAISHGIGEAGRTIHARAEDVGDVYEGVRDGVAGVFQ